ncbi:hypothetical protein [Reyranella sp.]|uniref:hypothetical protein n=1 Tax=Reyranella sp. TaxID=1929291 RepID=UPI00121D0398|nr:hypothetical protein [Reyranella sp.]TAJ84562.1 MAG: hypothetical protein EPO50_17895 [Reyranella sp.]
MNRQVKGKAQTTKLAERACQVGGAVCAASIACAQAQLPDWTWLFVVTAALGAAAFCSGGLFLILDGLHAISKSSKRTEIIKRGFLLSLVAVPLVAIALATFFWFPPAARLFNQPERHASGETAPSPPPSPPPSPSPGQSTASNPPPAPPAVSMQPAIPAQPPIVAQPAPLPAPTGGTSAAPTTTPPATPPTPPPRVQETPIVEETEFVSLYGNTPRTLCGQPRLSARPSSVAKPSPTGWILYSTDYLSGFQEQPLVYGEPIRFGNCTLILERIEPELPRFDFKVINRE